MSLVGGDKPGLLPAYIALGAIALAFLCSLMGFIEYHHAFTHAEHEREAIEQTITSNKVLLPTADLKKKELNKIIEEAHEGLENKEKVWSKIGKGTLWELVRLRSGSESSRGTSLTIGFKIDHLSCVMFLMADPSVASP